MLEQTARIDERPAALFAFLEPLCEAGNLQVIGAEEHGPWRRVLLEVLAGRPSHERHFGEFVSLVEELAERWAGTGGDPVLLQKDLTALSLRMICAYALGGADSGLVRAEEVVEAFEVVLSADDPTAQRASLALDYLRATVDRVIAAHEEDRQNAQGDDRQNAPEDDRSDLIRALLAARTSPARIRDTVMVTMLAAHHTTGVAVSWTLHLLARHPEVAERVAAELDRVLGDRSAPDYGDLRELTYLDMVLKESMRLCPPGPYGARETTEDMVLSGADGTTYDIPARTTVFYPFWAVHMNPDHWPEPEEFRPERFTPEAVAARSRFAYVPFGVGPRSCEGAGLAMVEAQLTLAVLLKRFRFRPVAGHEVTPVERFVLWAADDIPMVVTPRAATDS
ncbi:cytochrome P450 [Streptomyces venezuelae]|uniref:cytochrome P450 n=1 Tax=Streptomyces venezuelae TaxID=54571 RepID=UPI0037B8841D